MSHLIQTVKAKPKYIIEALFYNGDRKQYDVKILFPIFPQFKIFQTESSLFEKVMVDAGGYGVSWNDELDLDAETIWEDGILLETQKEPDLNHLLAYKLAMTRESVGMTQKELSEKTGIYQADISKIERGLGNPSLLTLKRLAEGMNMSVKVDFVYKNEK